MAKYVEVFPGKNGDWYWHRVAENGQIVAEGGEGYSSRVNADQAARRENPDAEVRFTNEQGDPQEATR